MQIRARRIAIAATVIVLLGIVAVAAASKMGRDKMRRQVGVNVRPVRVALPHEAKWIERGRQLFNTRGCAGCHGPAGAGQELVNRGGMLVVAPNITPAAGSAVAGFRPVDWVRVLRHGVKRNDKVVMMMPSEDYNRLTDEEIGALVGYAMVLPPLPGKGAVVEPSLPWLALYGVGAIRDAYEQIDHRKPPPAAALVP